MPPPTADPSGAAAAPSFGAATAVRALTSHTYRAELSPAWAVGSVPHGGVVTSVLLRAAALHFATTLAGQGQPHAVTLHAEFLRRTSCGPATLTVRDVKLGRQTSTVHVALSQPGRGGAGEETDEVVAYITHTNLAAESGPSFGTGWALDPPPPPLVGGRPGTLRAPGGDGDGDANWALWRDRPFPHFRRVLSRMDVYLPREGQVLDSLCDEWLRFRSGERFDNASLGLVSDLWPQLIESLVAARQRRSGQDGVDGKKPMAPPPLAMYWYPTLLLNLDIKKALPPDGVEWLFARVRAKQIRNGRQDLEVVILDETGDIVALSHHVALVLDAKRNTAKRRVAGGSKI